MVLIVKWINFVCKIYILINKWYYKIDMIIIIRVFWVFKLKFCLNILLKIIRVMWYNIWCMNLDLFVIYEVDGYY